MPPGLQDLGDLRDAGGKHEEIGLQEDPVRVPARLDGDAAAAEGRELRGELAERFLVRNRHDCAECIECPRGGNPAPRQTDHRHPFAPKVRLHDASNSVNLLSADKPAS